MTCSSCFTSRSIPAAASCSVRTSARVRTSNAAHACGRASSPGATCYPRCCAREERDRIGLRPRYRLRFFVCGGCELVELEVDQQVTLEQDIVEDEVAESWLRCL